MPAAPRLVTPATSRVLTLLCGLLAACGSGDGGSSPAEGDGPAPAAGEFGALCEEDEDCDDQTCVFSSDRGGEGFCSRQCDAVSDCPSNYDCDFIGGAARKHCIPEDRLDACEASCDSYDFFGCLYDDKLAVCIEGCAEASVEERKRFVECDDALHCNTECIEALVPGGGPWGEVEDDCERDGFLDAQCDGLGLPPRGYSCHAPGAEPAEAGCEAMPLPDAWCCEG